MAVQTVSTILSSIPSLSVCDEDVGKYLAGILGGGAGADGSISAPEDVDAMVQPFLDSYGLGDAAIKDAVQRIFAGMVAAGLVQPKARRAAVGVRGPALLSSGAMSLAGSETISSLLHGAGLDDEDPSSADAPKLLAAPVKLGATSLDASTLDFLWGRESNAFRNQNKAIDYLETGDARAAKRAARDARKEESKAQYEKSKAQAAAVAEAAADAAAGKVSSGTVTYRVTEERKEQDINITGFNMGYGGSLLLEGADLKIAMSRRYGLVGRNGMGKSTLLRHMAQGEVHGAGAQLFPTNLRVLHVEQEVAGDATPVLATVLAADVERAALLAEEARLIAYLGESSAADAPPAGADASTVSASETAATSGGSSEISTARGPLGPEAANARLRQISVRLAAIDSDSAEPRAARILTGLGFTNDMTSWPTKSLSGGWRMRVALACALFCEPDILCLDEPTNHIDAKSAIWLVDYLNEYPHTLIVVSHDRWFLNQVCTDVIHLTNKKLEYYKGDYDTFERLRAEKRRHAEKAAESQEAKRAHIQSFIDKFRYNAKRASLVQSRIKALERMDVLEEVADDPRWKFEFPDPGPLGIPVLQVDDVTFGYKAGKPLFTKVNFSIDMSSRIALVGPNGVGKSTLLKLLLGELEPQDGTVVRNPKLRMACFTQHHVNQLDLSATPMEYLTRLFPGAKPEALRAHLGSFGVSGDLALQVMGTLSGGQKSRVAFSVLTWKKPHILVLDEPSNNLDIETIDAVIVALANFAGGLVVVSHDQHFVESVCDEIFVVGHPPRRITKFAGEFKDYRKVAEAEKAFKLDADE